MQVIDAIHLFFRTSETASSHSFINIQSSQENRAKKGTVPAVQIPTGTTYTTVDVSLVFDFICSPLNFHP